MPGVLDAMRTTKRTDIPDFPHDAIAIKPVYEVIPGPNNKAGQNEGLEPDATQPAEDALGLRPEQVE